MMVYVAAIAVGCTALPILRIAPVPVLTAAALFMVIPVIHTRGRNRHFLIGAVSLACLAIIAVSTCEIRSMWQKAELYRHLAKKHANRHDMLAQNIPYFDKHPEMALDVGPWEEKRKQWMRFVDYDALMSQKYDRAARYPFLTVDPQPKPWRSPGLDPLLDANGGSE
jgi:hypothetical protein